MLKNTLVDIFEPNTKKLALIYLDIVRNLPNIFQKINFSTDTIHVLKGFPCRVSKNWTTKSI